MFGVDKLGGVIVAASGGNDAGISLEDAVEAASAEETVIVPVDVVPEPTDDNPDPAPVSVNVMLAPSLNRHGGGIVWQQVEDESSALRSAVGVSQMASMLRDTHRNEMYQVAITEAVQRFRKAHGRSPVVLDIGCGTGLLSLMAARAGAAVVYAVEMFEVMASIAAVVTEANTAPPAVNDFGESMCTIHVIPKKSTAIVTGVDMPANCADILVTEIFDSVLLGEGILPTLRHAREHLLTRTALIVPHSGVIFAQLIDSPALDAMRNADLARLGEDGMFLARKDWSDHCDGGCVPLPLHFNRIQPPPKPVGDPFVVFSFDFQNGEIKDELVTALHRVRTLTGTVHAVSMWWELHVSQPQSDKTATAVLSTHPSVFDNLSLWQDHWCPIVYPLQKPLTLSEPGVVELLSVHSLTTVWFKARTVPETEQPASKLARTELTPDPDICTCGVHGLNNWQRIAMLNDVHRNATIVSGVKKAFQSLEGPAVCVDVGDGSLFGLAALQAKVDVNVFSIENVPMSSVHVPALVQALGPAVEARFTVLTGECGELSLLDDSDDCEGGEVDEEAAGSSSEPVVSVIVGEPFYYRMQNLQLWQLVNFWLKANAIAERHCGGHVPIVCPAKGRIRAVVVQFDELWKGHGDAGIVSGFDHSLFDSFQRGWHVNRPLAFPLWMYRYTALSEVHTVVNADFASVFDDALSLDFTIPVTSTGTAHGLVLWTDYLLDADGEFVLSGAPSFEATASSHSKQTVHFLLPFSPVTASVSSVNGTIRFTPQPELTVSVNQ